MRGRAGEPSAAAARALRRATLAALALAVGAAGCGRAGGPGGRETAARGPQFVGSSSCRSCHESFYRKWATSYHGLAMRPFTGAFAESALAPQTAPLAIGGERFRAVLAGDSSYVLESGPAGRTRHPIAFVLGGKNVCYFLTPRERGRLQALPVAFDVRRREWFDLAASGVRHFPGEDEPVRPERWTATQLTFNTSCFSCHVSQLERAFDAATGTYRTRWREPGIDCETCHGPAGDHLRAVSSARRGGPGGDLAIVRPGRFSHAQVNDLCAPCHAKMTALTPTFAPGEPYFDNFDLVTLEDPDFYPDGRDLGENYTMTQWLLNPCARAGRMDCLTCHTSSGRFRQAAHPDSACAPCHADKLADPPAHTRHAAASPGSRCLACHMPRTEFARMTRHDHSLRPPSPSATLEFGSPNACNLCHRDRDARWTDAWVRKWRGRDYQAAIVGSARLVAAARRGDWRELPRMLDAITAPGRDEVYAASLVRLLGGCADGRKWPVLERALRDPSPLVRSSAATALAGRRAPEAVAALLAATGDPVRLVRVRAAAALAALPRAGLAPAQRARLGAAARELVAAYGSRPDDYRAEDALGGYLLDSGDARGAVGAYEAALRLEPGSAALRVNAASAYSAVGRPAEAERSLRAALALEPGYAPAHLALGLLLADAGRAAEAERALRAALASEPRLAPAAYNLSVLLAERRSSEALDWARRAADWRPDVAGYAYGAAFLERAAGDTARARERLRALVRAHPEYADGYRLLGEILEREGRAAEARSLYKSAATSPSLEAAERERFRARLERRPAG